MPIYTLTIPEALNGVTVRRAALSGLGMSSGQFKRAKFHGEVLLDGAPVLADRRVAAGQVLTLHIPELAHDAPAPCDVPIPIAYEDEHFYLIDKPAPLPTARSTKQQGPTLENALYAQLGCPADYVFRPVNRLDKGTSGLMAVAKTAHAQHLLQQLLHTPEFTREYLAVVEGAPPQDAGVIDLPIGKADGATVRREVRADGRPAVTHYAVVRRGAGRAVVRLRLETGRTHQIRVHLAAVGCPVCGDFLYGKELPELPGRFALHSARVRVLHPVTREWVERESGLPLELEGLCP